MVLDLDPHLSCIQTLVQYTDSVVVFVCLCVHTLTPQTLIGRGLCTRHCAGHLGGGREQNKPESCSLESTAFLSETSEEEGVLGDQGLHWGLLCKG